MIDKQKQYKRQNAWNEKHYEKMTLSLPFGLKDRWKEQAKEAGMTLAQYIISKVSE